MYHTQAAENKIRSTFGTKVSHYYPDPETETLQSYYIKRSCHLISVRDTNAVH